MPIFFAFKVFRARNARLGVDPNVGVAKDARGKNGYRDEAAVALAERDHIIGKRHLRGVVGFVVQHAQKNLRRGREVDEFEIGTVHLDSAIGERPRMIVVAAADCDRAIGHRFLQVFVLQRVNLGESRARSQHKG